MEVSTFVCVCICARTRAIHQYASIDQPELLRCTHKSRTPLVHKTTTLRCNTTQARTSWCSDCRVIHTRVSQWDTHGTHVPTTVERRGWITAQYNVMHIAQHGCGAVGCAYHGQNTTNAHHRHDSWTTSVRLTTTVTTLTTNEMSILRGMSVGATLTGAGPHAARRASTSAQQ